MAKLMIDIIGSAEFIQRLEKACEINKVLLTQGGTDPHINNHDRTQAFCACIKKGVSATWLFHGTGPFWNMDINFYQEFGFDWAKDKLWSDN